MNDTGDGSRLTDANGEPYDPRGALKAIASGDAETAMMNFGSASTIKATLEQPPTLWFRTW